MIEEQSDIVLYELISQFGPLTIEHVIDLVAAYRTTHPELELTHKNSIRYRLGPDRPLRGDKHIYFCEGNHNRKYYASYRISKRQEGYLQHDLGLTDVLVAFYKTGRLLEVERNREKKKDAINQDAKIYLSLPLPDRIGKVATYLEYDTGTEGYKQVEDRVARYVNHWNETGEKFQFLFVTQSAKKLPQHVENAAKYVPRYARKLYLFTTYQEALERPLEAIWWAVDGARYPMLPMEPVMEALPQPVSE